MIVIGFLFLDSNSCFWQPGKTLSARKWHAAFSEDGRLDIAKVLRRIQRGVILPLLPSSM